MILHDKYERTVHGDSLTHAHSHHGAVVASPRQQKLYKVAFALSVFTIVYNIVEGVVATAFGYEDETFALFGFGLDSFIETISGIGIAHMIYRFRQNNNTMQDDFERTALRVTGFAFYALTLVLLAMAVNNALHQHRPQTTFWGVVIALISIAVMLALIYGKKNVGRELRSEAILADANCTKVCIYMSVVLLISSGIYELTQFAYADAIGTAGLAYFSATEGKECFEKARSGLVCACGHD
jgi:putative Mn2+ efflux pump MntP